MSTTATSWLGCVGTPPPAALARASTTAGVVVRMGRADALRALTAYAWPSNVREFRTVLRRRWSTSAAATRSCRPTCRRECCGSAPQWRQAA